MVSRSPTMSQNDVPYISTPHTSYIVDKVEGSSRSPLLQRMPGTALIPSKLPSIVRAQTSYPLPSVGYRNNGKGGILRGTDPSVAVCYRWTVLLIRPLAPPFHRERYKLLAKGERTFCVRYPVLRPYEATSCVETTRPRSFVIGDVRADCSALIERGWPCGLCKRRNPMLLLTEAELKELLPTCVCWKGAPVNCWRSSTQPATEGGSE